MTYVELSQKASNGQLINRLSAAVAIAADTIRAEDSGTANHANRLLWAKSAVLNPQTEAQKMIWLLLAQNVGLTSAQIDSATDSALQSAVNSVVNLFATGS